MRDGATEIGASDLKLSIDGAPKTFTYDPDTGRLSRTAGRPSFRRHTVEVTAEDRAGNVADRSWSFRVVRGR